MLQQVTHGHIKNEGRNATMQRALRIEHEFVDGEFDTAGLVGVRKFQAKQPRQEKAFECGLISPERRFESVPGRCLVHATGLFGDLLVR